MMKVMGFFIYFCLSFSVFSQIIYNDEGHIPQNYQIDWTSAGLYDNIIPTNIINVDDYTDADDDDKLQNAIAAAQSTLGVVDIIKFSNRQYNLSEPVELDNTDVGDGIIFQGCGADQTKLYFTCSSNVNCFNFVGDAGTVGSEQYLSADFQMKTNSISGNFSSFNENDWVRLSEYGHPVFEGATIIDYFFGEVELDSDADWATGCVGQITQIQTKINNNNLILKDMASKSYDTDLDLWLRKITPIQNIGIENLKIERSTSGNAASSSGQGSNIKFLYAVNCWVKGVESYHTKRHHIHVEYCSHIEVSGCYISYAKSYERKGFGYGVLLTGSVTNCLIENNVFKHLRHAMVIQAGSNCNVFAYNYSRQQYWEEQGNEVASEVVPSNPYFSCGADLCLHGNYPFSNLFEQNYVERIIADKPHGSNGAYNAFVRNYCFDDDGNYMWGYIKIHDAPNTSVIGCELDDIGGDGNSSFAIDMYGKFTNVLTDYESMAPVTHSQAYLSAGIREGSYLEDLSYYYSSTPFFVTDAQFTFPSVGPNWYWWTQDIPARDRYLNASVKTYNKFPTTQITMSGTLSGDETWRSSITCTDDVIVPSGVELTILPGAQISFPDGKKLIVYGTLNAIGTSSEDISFACSDAGEDWYGISFENGSSGELQYCWFNDAFYAVYGKQSAPKVSNCSFNNGMYAFYAYMGDWSDSPFANNTIQNGRIGVTMSNPTNLLVDQCTIDGSTLFGMRILATGATNEIMETDIKNSVQDGIYMYNSDPYLYDNNIYYNGDDGLNIRGGSDPNLHDFAGNNVVAYNGEWGINVYSDCVPVLGAYGSDWEDGNSYYGNGIGELYSASATPINARNNWWGQIYADTTLLRINGSFYCSPMLGFMDPNPVFDAPLSKSLAENSRNEVTEIQAGAIDSVALDLFTKAHYLQTAKKFEEAIPIYQQIIDEHPYSQQAEMAVIRLARCYKRTEDKSEGKAVVAGYADHQAEAVAIAAQYEAGDWELDDDNIDAAIDYFTGVAHAQKTRSQEALLDVWNIHFNITGNEGQQKTLLKQYEKWYGVDANVIDMKLAMRLISGADARKWFAEHEDELGKKQLSLSESNIPKQYALHENYPNPFNPGTTIAFDVPKDARVQVNVYNIRGQLVQTIVDETKAAGHYAVQWNALNYSTGVYMYEMISGDFREVKKMLVVK